VSELEDFPVTASESTTEGVQVQVRAQYSPPHSDPQGGRWFFIYKIRITNRGEQTVQLLTRHWSITDGSGQVEEVDGPGVVGEQPTLQPGEAFEYSSGCPLPTPFGSMEGSYQMAREGGGHFEAVIAPFELRQPHALH